MPTEAVVVINGKEHVIKVNSERSDQTGFFFGEVGGYTIGSNFFMQKTVLKLQVILMAPDNKILVRNYDVK